MLAIATPTFGDHLASAGTAMRGGHPSNLDGAHARDCLTVKALVDYGMQRRDAVGMVMNRRTMEGYVAEFIAKWHPLVA